MAAPYPSERDFAHAGSPFTQVAVAMSADFGAAFNALLNELTRATTKFPPSKPGHESYAVILEELDEFWDHVKADTYDSPAAKKELLQIACTAMRAYMGV